MAKPSQVLQMLIPNGGYVQRGDAYEDIEFLECNPISKEEFETGFIQYNAWKAQQEAEIQAKRTAAFAKLEALGLDEDDLKALGL